MRKNILLAAVLCLAGTLPILTRAADEKSSDAASVKPAAATKPLGRLPNHYRGLVDTTQREKIYAIQTTYAEKIEDLQEQLKELMLQRDDEIRAVLTMEQQKKLDELISAVKVKSKPVRKAPTEKETSGGDKAAKAAN